MKIPEPANRVFIHDNTYNDIDGRALWVVSQYCNYLASDMQTKDIAVYRNSFRDVATLGSTGVIAAFVDGVYFMNNVYRPGGASTWLSQSGCSKGSTRLIRTTSYHCPGGEITAENMAGNGTAVTLDASDSRCDLRNVSRLFR